MDSIRFPYESRILYGVHLNMLAEILATSVTECIAAVARLTSHLVCDESSTSEGLSTSTNIINMDDATFPRKIATSTCYCNSIVVVNSNILNCYFEVKRMAHVSSLLSSAASTQQGCPEMPCEDQDPVSGRQMNCNLY